MPNIPHDYYLKHTNPRVLDEVLDFHVKANFTIHPATRHYSGLHRIPAKTLNDLTGNELRLHPDMDATLGIIDLPANPESKLYRNESGSAFNSSPIGLNTLKSLSAPFLRKKNSAFKRGYPSGGALYPIEIFFCHLSEPDDSWPCPERVLHLLPNSRTFEIIPQTQSIDKLQEAIIPTGSNIGSPSLAILYIAYLPKTLFKYRYRGYRLALMETGSLYMLADLKCKELHLENRIWSGYTDHMICKHLSLNPALFLPICVQLIGRS
ncbi:hypothetical protein D3C76_672780 [compost metagenome]